MANGILRLASFSVRRDAAVKPANGAPLAKSTAATVLLAQSGLSAYRRSRWSAELALAPKPLSTSMVKVPAAGPASTPEKPCTG